MKIANRAYDNKNALRTAHEILLRDQKRYFKKIVSVYGKYNYYYYRKKTLLSILMLSFYTFKRNVLSPKRNVWLLGKFGDNLKICHANVVVARAATIGNNVVFHGNNCVGVKNDIAANAPKIGDNVDVGYGAILIGDIEIANNVKIGAGSIVTKNCLDEGGIYAGSPARRIK